MSAVLQYLALVPGILRNQYVFLQSTDRWSAIESANMIRRIISQTILLASLLFAGLPAFACAQCAPTDVCCPTGQPALCNVDRSAAGSSGVAQHCGTVGSALFAADESANDFNRHLKRSDVPTLLIAPPIAQASRVASIRLSANSVASSFTPSYTLLYLSTGRLRL